MESLAYAGCSLHTLLRVAVCTLAVVLKGIQPTLRAAGSGARIDSEQSDDERSVL